MSLPVARHVGHRPCVFACACRATEQNASHVTPRPYERLWGIV